MSLQKLIEKIYDAEEFEDLEWDDILAILESAEVMAQALEFYGDKNNWDERWASFGGDDDQDGDVNDVITMDDVVIQDDGDGPFLTYGGKRAREAKDQVDKICGGEG